MKPHPILFAPIDEGERCPHGKLLPMPKTREQREAERKDFARRFFWWCMGVWSLLMVAAMCIMRGCR
jgi:hypothetical protein